MHSVSVSDPVSVSVSPCRLWSFRFVFFFFIHNGHELPFFFIRISRNRIPCTRCSRTDRQKIETQNLSVRNLLFLGHVHVHISLTGGIFFGATLTCNFYSRVCTFCFFVLFCFWGGPQTFLRTHVYYRKGSGKHSHYSLFSTCSFCFLPDALMCVFNSRPRKRERERERERAGQTNKREEERPNRWSHGRAFGASAAS